MPKQAKFSTKKVRQICQEYPDEFSATPAGDLQQPLRRVSQMRQKVFLEKATEKVSDTKENWRRRAIPKVSKPIYNSIK